MSTLRWLEDTTAGSGSGTLRWLEDTTAGSGVSNRTVRWLEDTTAGVGTVLLDALADREVEPEVAFSLTARLSDGTAADTYTWVKESGPAVAITGTGATVSVLPSSGVLVAGQAPPTGVVVIRVTATKGGVVSAPRRVTITVRPQLEWVRKPGGQWLGQRVLTRLPGGAWS